MENINIVGYVVDGICYCKYCVPAMNTEDLKKIFEEETRESQPVCMYCGQLIDADMLS